MKNFKTRKILGIVLCAVTFSTLGVVSLQASSGGGTGSGGYNSMCARSTGAKNGSQVFQLNNDTGMTVNVEVPKGTCGSETVITQSQEVPGWSARKMNAGSGATYQYWFIGRGDAKVKVTYENQFYNNDLNHKLTSTLSLPDSWETSGDDKTGGVQQGEWTDATTAYQNAQCGANNTDKEKKYNGVWWKIWYDSSIGGWHLRLFHQGGGTCSVSGGDNGDGSGDAGGDWGGL